MSKRLLILGPPGAGKGTQAARIAEHYEIPAISTGDIFRKNIAEQTELGVKVKAIIEAGDYVPDELTNDLVRDRLTWDDTSNGFLLDGYPRTLGQVEALDGMLADRGEKLDRVLELTADVDEVVGRLLKRAAEQNRVDDNEDTIRNRMSVYAEQTKPLIDVYTDRGLLVKVDGLGEIEEVSQRIFAALD